MWETAEYSKVIEAMEAVDKAANTLQVLETLEAKKSKTEYEKAVVHSLKEIVTAITQEMEKGSSLPTDGKILE